VPAWGSVNRTARLHLEGRVCLRTVGAEQDSPGQVSAANAALG
jgi:hypothetical protein